MAWEMALVYLSYSGIAVRGVHVYRVFPMNKTVLNISRDTESVHRDYKIKTVEVPPKNGRGASKKL